MLVFLKGIDRFLARCSIGIIRLYQKTLSPDKGLLSFFFKGMVCSCEPHCSEYGLRVMKRYGFWHGLPKISDRILSCSPSSMKHYDPEFYKVVFISSAPIGIPFLELLAEDKRFEVVGVVTQKDKPVGRGLKMSSNVIKTRAQELFPDAEADFIQTPDRIHPEKSLEGKNFFDWLVEKQPDFLVVLAYGKLIPQEILDIPSFAPINVHGSLLPQYRGASPIQSVFLNKEAKSWITIMHMDAGMDTGAIVDQLSFSLAFDWTCKDLIEELKKRGPEFLADTLWLYGKGEIGEEAQDEQVASYCSKLSKEEAEVAVFDEPLSGLYAKYRGYALWPKIWFTHKEKKVIIEELVLDKALFELHQDAPLLSQEGLNPAVVSALFKPEGKKAMDFASFQNGYLK